MRVLISGGGTGGHIYPALAIIKEISKREPKSNFLYVGTANGLEADIVKKTDIPFEAIHITGFRRKLSFENVKTVYRFLAGVRKSKKIIKSFKPDIVIGTGGYVCGPVVYAASKLGVATLIHEQNVVPGLTNKFLSKYTDGVALSFDGSAAYFNHPQLRITGNPRATEVREANGKAGRDSLGIPASKKVILIVGGSRGARAINEAFLEMIERIGETTDVHYIYVTGDVHYEQVQQEIARKDMLATNVTVKPFIYNMPDVLAGTDLIINRAGASFLAEITSLGLPSLLIPSPYVTNNHQEKNARWLEEAGAARVILEKDLTGNLLFEHINELISNTDKLENMRDASQTLGFPNASPDIYQFIYDILQRDSSRD